MRWRAEGDPLVKARARLLEIGVDADELAEVETRVRDDIAVMHRAVLAEPMPEACGAVTFVFADSPTRALA